MGVGLILIVLFVIWVIIKVREDRSISTSDIQWGVARRVFSEASGEGKEKILAAQNVLEKIIINNIRCLPKEVLDMEYTQKAIRAFIKHYVMYVVSQKLTNPEHLMAVHTLTLLQLHKKGALKTSDVDFDCDKDPSFKAMPMLINAMAGLPIENQTALLIRIEKHMESILGRRVRYIGQYPTDNPLNSQEE